jgi:hypothetical protein
MIASVNIRGDWTKMKPRKVREDSTPGLMERGIGDTNENEEERRREREGEKSGHLGEQFLQSHEEEDMVWRSLHTVMMPFPADRTYIFFSK